MNRSACLLALAIAVGLSNSGFAQEIREEFWIADGPVYTTALGDADLYIGGEFSYVGPVTGGGAVVDPATGSLRDGSPVVAGTVRAAAADGAGGWYIGGEFTHVGDQARQNLAHILAGGTVDTWAPEANDRVEAMAVQGGVVYIGGYFTSVAGEQRNRIAALDAGSGLATAWNPDADAEVTAMVLGGSELFVAGSFAHIGGAQRHGLAALAEDTGLATAWDPDPDGPVYALVDAGDVVYVGGGFASIGGEQRRFVAAVTRDTAEATGWTTAADHPVWSLAVAGGVVYTSSYGVLSAFDAVTGQAAAWNPERVGYTLAASGGLVFSSNAVATDSGFVDYSVFAVDGTTGQTVWLAPADGPSYPCAVGQDGVYFGGQFTSLGGCRRNGLAALDLATGEATAWDPQMFGWACRTLTRQGDTIYVGGDFCQIGGQPRANLAALDAGTAAATAWAPDADGVVYALAAHGDTVLASGAFSSLGGQTRHNIAALDAAGGGQALDWDPDANGVVSSLLVVDSVVHVGGEFETIGGQPRNHLAALDPVTAQATAWDPAVGDCLGSGWFCGVAAIVASGDLVYVAGDFETAGGEVRQSVVALDRITGLAADWQPTGDFSVVSLGIGGGFVYLGGRVENVNGQARNGVAAVDAVTGNVSSWAPRPYCGYEDPAVVHAFAVSAGEIFIGGDFDNVGGRPRRHLLVVEAAQPQSATFISYFSATPAADGTVLVWGLPAYVLAGDLRLQASRDADAWEVAVVGGAGGMMTAVDRDASRHGGGDVTYRLQWRQDGTWSVIWQGTVAVTAVPRVATLAAPRPNPFNPRTVLAYSLARPGAAILAVFDARGREVARLLEGPQPAGQGEVTWDGCDRQGRQVPSGAYVARLETEDGIRVQKLTLVR